MSRLVRIGSHVIGLDWLIHAEPPDGEGRRRIWLFGGRAVDLTADEARDLDATLRAEATPRLAGGVVHAMPADPVTGRHRHEG